LSYYRKLRTVARYITCLFYECSIKFNIEKEQTLICSIICGYHVVEKGITMPNRRLGFGKDNVLNLINDCLLYIKLYGKDHEQLQYAVIVINEYKIIHDRENYNLETEIALKIDKILHVFGTTFTERYENYSREEYFKYNLSPFNIFSYSRHSLRNFEGDVDLEDIKKAIALAQNAPSACNRQSTRVKIVIDKVKIGQILDIQNGNRGFGHLADKYLILTSEQSHWGVLDRHGGYIDAGIYAMNLLYALHFYKIGVCPLNCYFTPKQDREIRKCLMLPKSEEIMLIMALGNLPENFYVAKSFRYSLEKIISII
jgi:nitroreductase